MFSIVIPVLTAVLSLSLCAHADEGLERINELGDQGLVSQSAKDNAAKKKPKPKGETYKAVEEEEQAPSNLFKGNPPPESNQVFLGAGTGFFAGFNVQGRYAYRVLKQGPLPDLNNSLYVEAGLGLTFYGTQADGNTATGFGVLAAGRWDFQLDEQWVFFGELGLGGSGVTHSENANVRGGGLFPVAGVGAIFNLAGDWAIRADVGYEFTGVGLVHRF